MGLMYILDHCLIYLTINMECEKKVTLWKLNSTVPNGRSRKEIEKDIKEYVELNDNNTVSQSVDPLSREKFNSKSTYLKRTKQAKMMKLHEKLKKLEEEHKIK